MVEINKCACGCGQPTIRKSRTGRAPLYASGACRVRALRNRRALAGIDGIPDIVHPTPVSVVSVPVDEQVARAVIEARAIGFAFQRLGTQARPDLAWRCSKVGDAIVTALAEFFPDPERHP